MNKLFASERRQLILNILEEKKRVTVKDLAKDVNVSEATLRTDLNTLEQENLLTRTHGGAVLNEDLSSNKISFSERAKENTDSKIIIAQKAINLINQKDCILLDASTTALSFAQLLKNSQLNITVVTNGISAAIELKENPGINVILIGGMARMGSMALEGLLGTNILNKIHIDTMFTSARGFSLEEGLTDFNVYEVELKKVMATKADKIVALLDYSKIGLNSIASFASCDQINTIISDKSLDSVLAKQLTAKNITLL